MSAIITLRSRVIAMAFCVAILVQTNSAQAFDLSDLLRLLFTDVRGTVTLVDGTPVSGARVSIAGTGWRDDTDASGVFVIRNVLALFTNLPLRIEVNGETFNVRVNARARGGATTELGAIRIGTIVSGQVVYPNNAPVAGAGVMLPGFARSGVTNAAGNFSVAVAAARFTNGLRIDVTADGNVYAFRLRNVTPVQGGTTNVGRLAIGTLLTGTLQFVNGSGVSGASVALRGGGSTTTAANGAFTLGTGSLATSATLDFSVQGDAFSADVALQPVAGGTTALGVFTTGTFVRGVVVKAGQPVNAATVAIQGGGSAVTAADGVFSIMLPVANFTALVFDVTAGTQGETIPVSSLTAVRGGTTNAGTLTLSGGGATWRFAEVLDASLGGSLNGAVHAMAVFDDGSGSALYVGGEFTTASTSTVNYIARWNGVNWSGVAGGFDAPVHALTVHDDGSGPALYAGGAFENSASGTPLRHVAKWNGAAWSDVSGGVPGQVNALASFDGDLYAGGVMPEPYFSLARWDGLSWNTLANGVQKRVVIDLWRVDIFPGDVHALTVYDDGSGPALYVGGQFDWVSSMFQYNIVKWNGSAFLPGPSVTSGDGSARVRSFWAPSTPGDPLFIGGHMDNALNDPHSTALFNLAQLHHGEITDSTGGVGNLPENYVSALNVFDDGTGARLYIGGNFDVSGSGLVLNNLARWDGTTLEAVTDGASVGVSGGAVNTLMGYQNTLFVGGSFTSAGASAAHYIARWQRN